MNILKAMMGNGDNSGGANLDGLMDQFGIMIENLKKDCYATFATKNELYNLE